jgi:hypothetical protein
VVQQIDCDMTTASACRDRHCSEGMRNSSWWWGRSIHINESRYLRGLTSVGAHDGKQIIFSRSGIEPLVE